MKPLILALVAVAFATGGCAVHEGRSNGKPDPPADKQIEPIHLVTQDDVGKVLEARMRASEMLISYHEIAGLEGQYQWHIGDSTWWVRLHGVPAEYFDMDKLDKSKTYRVTGVVLEQNYGVVEVWVDRIGPTN